MEQEQSLYRVDMKYKKKKNKKTKRAIRMTDWALSAKFRLYYGCKAKLKTCLRQLTR